MEYKPIKNIIFDIDGTMINSYQASLTTLRETIIKVTGQQLNDEILYKHFGVPLKEALSIIGIDSKYHEEIEKKNDEEYPKMVHLIKIFDGIEDILKALTKEHIVLGLVTSEGREEFVYVFEPLPIRKYFSEFVLADDTEKHKPHPDPLLLMMKKQHMRPEETIYIGDALYDSLACKAANIRFGLALWGTLKPDIPADYYFEKPSDILTIIDK